MRLWQWLAVGFAAWILLSLLIGAAWTVAARELRRRHRKRGGR